jgi:hypothetical protein
MRTTLSLDNDVAALLAQVQKASDATLKQVVNEALRHGLAQMSQPVVPNKPLRTQPVDSGKRYFPHLDDTWEALAEAEGNPYD